MAGTTRTYSRRRRGGLHLAAFSVMVVLAASLAAVRTGATWGASAYDPAADGYSLANVTAHLGAADWWDAGYTGQGIDVALIDTGVSPVAGLSGPGKVVYGPDLSLEAQNPALRNLDTAGHGTFMAGLIAGHDPNLTAPYSAAPASVYRGVAPDARIVSLKVGTADGGVDVSQVIAAIDWVVQHAHDSGLNIRVINLAYGTNSPQGYTTDPLAYAAEQAWKKGIVVVAAAGNTGFQKGKRAECLADPAYDPYVIAVAGADTMGTETLKDDQVDSYSSGGAGKCKNPDFSAPGSHLQGLRVVNSYLDATHPEGQIDGRYFRGSGTSEATAITSGAIALLLQKYPDLTPDAVKKFVMQSSHKLGGTSGDQQGAGELQLGDMLKKKPEPNFKQRFADATGTGSLELARGTDHVSRDGVLLTGERDIFGVSFDAAAMATAEAAGTAWSGNSWNGSTWSGSTWSGSTWSGSTWSGSTWSGNTWSGSTWSGSTWSGASFSGSTWSGNTWSGDSWMGATWG